MLRRVETVSRAIKAVCLTQRMALPTREGSIGTTKPKPSGTEDAFDPLGIFPARCKLRTRTSRAIRPSTDAGRKTTP
ncbi:hypothetical protein [Rhodopila sp.]|uniref:hypothetical protein n=1 Tax=Rhodopila sp. TaxID=2480087 RepID=UPI003D126476